MKRSGVAIATVVTIVQVLSSGPVNAQQPTPSHLTLQFLAYELPPDPRVSVELSDTPLDEALKAIATAGYVRLRYAPTVQSLNTRVSVSLKNVAVEAALREVLGANALAFVVTSRSTVFVYPRTRADEEKYAQTTRDFTVASGKTSPILTILNQMAAKGELNLEPFGERPAMASDSVRTIRVRATAKVMDQIAKVIAANDR